MSKIHKQYEYRAGNSIYVLDDVIPEQDDSFEEDGIPDDNVDAYCADLVIHAQNEAEEIVNNARQQAEFIINEARQKAFEEGMEQGKTQGFEVFKNKITEAVQLVEQIQEEKFKILSDMEGEILKLSIKIAEKILNNKLSEDENAFLSVISGAIKKAGDAEKISVFISPGQFDNINEVKQNLQKHLKSVKCFEIIKKEMDDSFDCLIETDCEQIDAGIKAQISQIEQAFELSHSYA